MNEKLNRVLHLRESIDTGLPGSALDIVEAVVAGEYIKAKNLCTDLTPTSPDDYDKPCSTCGGSGERVMDDSRSSTVTCFACHGTGKEA